MRRRDAWRTTCRARGGNASARVRPSPRRRCDSLAACSTASLHAYTLRHVHRHVLELYATDELIMRRCSCVALVRGVRRALRSGSIEFDRLSLRTWVPFDIDDRAAQYVTNNLNNRVVEYFKLIAPGALSVRLHSFLARPPSRLVSSPLLSAARSPLPLSVRHMQHTPAGSRRIAADALARAPCPSAPSAPSAAAPMASAPPIPFVSSSSAPHHHGVCTDDTSLSATAEPESALTSSSSVIAAPHGDASTDATCAPSRSSSPVESQYCCGYSFATAQEQLDAHQQHEADISRLAACLAPPCGDVAAPAGASDRAAAARDARAKKLAKEAAKKARRVLRSISVINQVTASIAIKTSTVTTHTTTEVNNARTAINQHTDEQVSAARDAVTAHTTAEFTSARTTVTEHTRTTINQVTDVALQLQTKDLRETITQHSNHCRDETIACHNSLVEVVNETNETVENIDGATSTIKTDVQETKAEVQVIKAEVCKVNAVLSIIESRMIESEKQRAAQMAGQQSVMQANQNTLLSLASQWNAAANRQPQIPASSGADQQQLQRPVAANRATGGSLTGPLAVSGPLSADPSDCRTLFYMTHLNSQLTLHCERILYDRQSKKAWSLALAHTDRTVMAGEPTRYAHTSRSLADIIVQLLGISHYQQAFGNMFGRIDILQHVFERVLTSAKTLQHLFALDLLPESCATQSDSEVQRIINTALSSDRFRYALDWGVQQLRWIAIATQGILSFIVFDAATKKSEYIRHGECALFVMMLVLHRGRQSRSSNEQHFTPVRVAYCTGAGEGTTESAPDSGLMIEVLMTRKQLVSVYGPNWMHSSSPLMIMLAREVGILRLTRPIIDMLLEHTLPHPGMPPIDAPQFADARNIREKMTLGSRLSDADSMTLKILAREEWAYSAALNAKEITKIGWVKSLQHDVLTKLRDLTIFEQKYSRTATTVKHPLQVRAEDLASTRMHAISRIGDYERRCAYDISLPLARADILAENGRVNSSIHDALREARLSTTDRLRLPSDPQCPSPPPAFISMSSSISATSSSRSTVQPRFALSLVYSDSSSSAGRRVTTSRSASATSSVADDSDEGYISEEKKEVEEQMTSHTANTLPCRLQPQHVIGEGACRFVARQLQPRSIMADSIPASTKRKREKKISSEAGFTPLPAHHSAVQRATVTHPRAPAAHSSILASPSSMSSKRWTPLRRPSSSASGMSDAEDEFLHSSGAEDDAHESPTKRSRIQASKRSRINQ
jgi:hypothetical protein